MVDALKVNIYIDQFIKNCQNTTTTANQPEEHSAVFTLPYIQEILEKIAKNLEPVSWFHVNVAHKPVKTEGSILTSRILKTRTKEQK